MYQFTEWIPLISATLQLATAGINLAAARVGSSADTGKQPPQLPERFDDRE
ncbi:hypothetical protein ACQP2K_40750 [Microbispora siamensis]